jgi:hypothetical protein
MDCFEVRRRLATGIGITDPVVEEHLLACEDCAAAALEEAGAKLKEGAPEPDSAEIETLLQGIGQRLAAERGVAAWLRSLPTWQRLVVAVLPAIVLPLVFGAASPRLDIAVYPTARLIGLALPLLVLSAVSLLVKLRPLYRPRLSARLPIFLAVLSLGVMALDVALPAAHSLHPASLGGTGADLLPRAMQCLISGLLLGFPSFLLTAMLDRSNDGWRDASVLGAVLAGLAGYLSLHLHCPIVAPAHLLVGHLTVLAAFLGLYRVVHVTGRTETA